MRKNQFLLFLLPAFLVACNSDDQERNIDITTDSYIMKTEIDGEERFATAFHAYGNTSLSSVTVIPPPGSGSSFELIQNPESSFAFSKEPALDDYKAAWPLEGTYQFDIITARGEHLEQFDFLEKIDLEIPQITLVHFNKGLNTINVKWKKVEGTVGSVVLLLNPAGKIIYNSDLLEPSLKEYVIGYPGENWLDMPIPGDKLMVQVQAFSYESDATLANNIYNMGIVTFSREEILWGQ